MNQVWAVSQNIFYPPGTRYVKFGYLYIQNFTLNKWEFGSVQSRKGSFSECHWGPVIGIHLVPKTNLINHSILVAGSLVLSERDGEFVAGKKEVSLAHCHPPPFRGLVRDESSRTLCEPPLSVKSASTQMDPSPFPTHSERPDLYEDAQPWGRPGYTPPGTPAEVSPKALFKGDSAIFSDMEIDKSPGERVAPESLAPEMPDPSATMRYKRSPPSESDGPPLKKSKSVGYDKYYHQHFGPKHIVQRVP